MYFIHDVKKALKNRKHWEKLKNRRSRQLRMETYITIIHTHTTNISINKNVKYPWQTFPYQVYRVQCSILVKVWWGQYFLTIGESLWVFLPALQINLAMYTLMIRFLFLTFSLILRNIVDTWAWAKMQKQMCLF